MTDRIDELRREGESAVAMAPSACVRSSSMRSIIAP